METEATRVLITTFLAARAAGDMAGITAALAEDATWILPQSSSFGPFVGRDAVAAALGGGVSGTLFEPGTIRREVHKVIVDGDTAAVQQRLSATTRQGEQYVNEYCWVYTCRDGKIAKLEEYADTAYASKVLGNITR